jgi:hypothetical protein
MSIMWTNVTDGRPPRSGHMTGLDQVRVDWLHEQLAQMVEWNKLRGCPWMLPLDTAIVMVLFALRHNLSPDVIGELFGCGSTTVSGTRMSWRFDRWCRLYDEIQEQAAQRRNDGFVPVGECADTDPFERRDQGINVQFVSTLSGQLADVGDPCPGVRHDSRAFRESGIAERWAGHFADHRPHKIVENS